MAAGPWVRRLSALADQELDGLLATPAASSAAVVGHRTLMRLIATAVCCHLDEHSRWHQDPAALAPLADWSATLAARQAPDGLFTSAANLVSPPDSAFTVNQMAQVQALLVGSTAVDARLQRLSSELAAILDRAAPGLLAGGVHTPNHRWVLAAALARLDRLTPDPRLRARAEEWLAEGVDIAPDGLYSERSPGYASAANNPSLIVLAEHLGRPELLEAVHRNLHAMAGLTDVDGTVESVHSRRQDQHVAFSVAPFALQFRRFALLQGCATCTAAARRAEPHLLVRPRASVLELLTEPRLAAELPDEGSEEGSRGGVRLHRYPSARLVRRVQGRSAATVYGGSDVPRDRRIASGLAVNPTFLRWRWGEVLLDSVRLSRAFFDLGPFRSEGLESDEQGDVHRLRERVSAAYYQPLPAEARRADGDYEVQHEGRFAAAMQFSERSRDEVWLQTELVVGTTAEEVSVDATFRGVSTGYAFELCFGPGGVLTGVHPLGDDRYELVQGHGSYRVGGDEVVFGPGGGSGPDRPPLYDPGEAYNFLAGTDARAGVRVYVTGRSPGACRLTLRGVWHEDDAPR